MLARFWRYAHLTLSIISVVFLLIASVTGIILAYDAIQKKATLPHSSKQENHTISIAQSIAGLRKSFSEIAAITIDPNNQVILEGIDSSGNNITAIVDPVNGQLLGYPKEDSDFIKQVTNLHRSLFLHNTGRYLMGIASFLLFFIAVTGLILLIKRQQGIQNIIKRIKKDFFSQYLHVYLGRISLIPIIIIALTGTILFLQRFEIWNSNQTTEIVYDDNTTITNELPLTAIPFFKNTPLNKVNKIEFPFSDDPTDYFVIYSTDHIAEVRQGDGYILKQTNLAAGQQLNVWSLDLHTGRTNIVWAIILGIACINILVFIYTGFAITIKRITGKKVKNIYNASNAQYIILYGTENGSTGHFAQRLLQQLLSINCKAHLAALNDLQQYPKATHLIIITATYGEGAPPANATQFLAKLAGNLPAENLQYCVVGFGSQQYPAYCQFAKLIDNTLMQYPTLHPFLPVHTVNEKNMQEWMHWLHTFIKTTALPLVANESVYLNKEAKITLKVSNIQKFEDSNGTFIIRFQQLKNKKIQSGDLIAIYPLNNHIERLYSIGIVNDALQIVVKLHEHGIGSQYLFNLKQQDTIKVRIVKNSKFQLPKHASNILMIANGTGIGPFLGMINQHEHKPANKMQLLCGFRAPSALTNYYTDYLNHAMRANSLNTFEFAYSRVYPNRYVLDLIKMNYNDIITILSNQGIIMICGSIAMQQDVENILDAICKEHMQMPLTYYKSNNQILTDCY